MSGGGRSLLTFLPAPVLVGDPEGRVVYVNPAFEVRFDVDGGRVTGQLIAGLFEGGGRESLLRALAETCGSGREVRFRLRERDAGWSAVLAPIQAEGDTVGSILLLQEEAIAEERVLSFHREIQEPLEQLEGALDTLLDQTGGRRGGQHRTQLEEGLRSVGRLRKRTEQLRATVLGMGRTPSVESFDPGRVVRSLCELGSAGAALGGHNFEQLVPAELPAVRGDGDRVGSVLTGYLQERLDGARPGTLFTLTAKSLLGGTPPCLVLTLNEVPPDAEAPVSDEDRRPPASLRDALVPLGGSVARTSDAVAGTTTAIRLPLA